MARILLVDDNKEHLLVFRELLKSGGHEVHLLLSGEQVIGEIQKWDVDLVITDLLMPGLMGGGVYDAIREHVGPHLPVLVVSGTTMKLKVRDPLLAYCRKPVDADVLLSAVEQLMQATNREQALKSDDPDMD
jgi:CheY-like chemotaxis protein